MSNKDITTSFDVISDPEIVFQIDVIKYGITSGK